MTRIENNQTVSGSSAKKLSLNDLGGKIKNEYNQIFWATGDMDLYLWANNCTFSDPFNSFGGNNSSLRFLIFYKNL
jgi:hypothetical protein